MKKIIVLLSLAALLGATPAMAQSLKGMSLNGSTGLVSIPSGRIGWEKSADFAIDGGYHTIIEGDVSTHIPKVSVSLFQTLEIGAAYDLQSDSDNSDLIINGKFQLPIRRASSIAVGANVQMLKRNTVSTNTNQIYIAATYPGDFFQMPADTTFVLGKSFGDGVPSADIDFGMGFDLLFMPEVFQGYVHWINDFANFSYSRQPIGADSNSRGVFNTGIRIDLGASKLFAGKKFVIDAIITDALDDNRAFSLGLTFGAALK